MLDRRAISLYRRFLYGDAETTRPIPESLKALHLRFWELLGPKNGVNRSELSTETLATCLIMWEQTTEEGAVSAKLKGRSPLLPIAPNSDFYVGSTEASTVQDGASVDWFKVKSGTRIVVKTQSGAHEEVIFVSLTKDGRLKVKLTTLGPDGKGRYRTYARANATLVTESAKAVG